MTKIRTFILSSTSAAVGKGCPLCQGRLEVGHTATLYRAADDSEAWIHYLCTNPRFAASFKAGWFTESPTGSYSLKGLDIASPLKDS